MTPEELKKIALESTKEEYEAIMDQLKQAAQQGSFSCGFKSISDGAYQQLIDAGYKIQKKTHYIRSAIRDIAVEYYEVSIK